MEHQNSWDESKIYHDENLLPGARKNAPVKLPPVLKKARAMERKNFFKPISESFLKEAKLLADYEDEFEYHGNPVRYYPAYELLEDDELRGYFSWRTRFREDDFAEAPLTFIYLHIYELINNIGVPDATSGYDRLLLIMREYGVHDSRLAANLGRWLNDYVVYYNLPRDLLFDVAQKEADENIEVLENIATESQENVIAAVKGLAPKWLSRSRFYADNQADMDRVIFNVLKRMAARYAKTCKYPLVDQFFGQLEAREIALFGGAVFCNILNRRNYAYAIDNSCAYKCEDGYWEIVCREVTPRGIRKLDNLLKTVDQAMRVAFAYPHKIKQEVATRWILKTIDEEIGKVLAEKKAAQVKPVGIDFSRLSKIRSDAAATQEKLAIEDDEEPGLAVIQPRGPEEVEPDGNGLNPQEYRLLHSLLYSQDLAWVRNEGYMLSVLVDGINEKLYDKFEDTVLDDTPALVEDYIAPLKEMIPA